VVMVGSLPELHKTSSLMLGTLHHIGCYILLQHFSVIAKDKVLFMDTFVDHLHYLMMMSI
jgi:hypothetical protein